MRRMRRLPLRRLRVERLWRLRRLWLLLVSWTLPRLLRREHVPTTSKDMNCYGRVMLDPAYSALLMAQAVAVAHNVDKHWRAS